MRQKQSELYVVGIGASAGGLDAIQQLFDHIPHDTGMAFVIIQHLSPDFKSLMPELLAKHTSMPIYTAEDKQTIKPNCIYLNQRNKNLHIKGTELYLLDKGPKHNLNLPIDIFFHTLGEEYKEKSIGVILSGTGSDGSRGIKTIKEGGGVIFVQDPLTAQFDGMPNSSISTGLSDFILNPKEIALRFNTLTNPKLVLDGDNSTPETNEVLINKILQEVHKYSDIDFREYKKNTLIRRLEKRMNINNIDDLQNYLLFLKSSQKEKEALKQDFLIGVTRFFRDPEAFKSLKDDIIPAICKQKKNTEVIRIWVPGCSTGEEVYSIAMLFDDYIRSINQNVDFKIFATDIDPIAIETASLGIFHINVVNEIEKEYLEKYFTKTGEKLTIIKRIREKIVFSNHNLIKSPPFIRMDLISCRNLLIYLDNNIQRKVIYNFQFALNRFGYLFLGSSESLGEVSKYFKTINNKWKIYQNISESKHVPIQMGITGRAPSLQYNSNTAIKISTPIYKFKENPENIFHKYLSKKYSPASIFYDRDFNIVYIKGDAGSKLKHREGLFENNLLKVVDKDLATIIRSTTKKLEKEEKDIIIKNITTEVDNEIFIFDLNFHKPKFTDELNDIFILQFSEENKIDNPIIIENVPIDSISKQRLEEIENELKATKTELQNVVEELETSNEELQSSNEELMASNEELQSTNEELQSVNEELYTVNAELQEKNKELVNLNNDVNNLLDNTDIGTLFLDSNLVIRKFTPSIKKHFNLKESDIGRSIENFASNFNEKIRSSIIIDSKKVLKTLHSIEKEIVDKEGNNYIKRISPFITLDKKIDGIVLTLIDTTQLKETEKELAVSETKYTQLFENLNEGFAHGKIIIDKNGIPTDWEYITINPAFERMIGIKADKIINKKISKVHSIHFKNNSNLLKIYGKTALTGKDQYIENYTTHLGKNYLAHVFCPQMGEFAATFADITDLKTKEAQITKSESELKRVQTLTRVGSWHLDLKTGEVDWTEELYKTFGIDKKDTPPTLAEQEKYFSKKTWKTLTEAIKKTQTTGIPYELELEIHHEDGRHSWLWAQGEADKKENGEIIALRGAAQDITEHKLIEKELVIARKKAEAANIHKNYFLANMSHEIRTPMNGVIGFSELLRDEKLSHKDRKKYLDIIDGNSKQLLNLIDDIIDIAKIEANELKISHKECYISDLVKDIEVNFNHLKDIKNKKNITIKSYIPKNSKDLVILTDPSRLRQVITNLLSNSLKFSDNGEISFGYHLDKKVLKFFVKDEGIGIPKEKLVEIFERFKQVNYDDNAKYGGTGLGLAICKGIVEYLGGKITVNSEINKGATFEFTIPLKLVKTKKKKELKTTTKNKDFLRNKTILIAEDDSMVKMIYSKIFTGTGANTIYAPTGKAAVDLYKNNANIDVILMDIRMPEMNGFDATTEILKINPNANIIMQSAYAMHDEKEKCFKNGCKDYLTKPIKKDELFDALEKWI